MIISLDNYRGNARNPRSWRGLSQADREIFAAHLDGVLKNARDFYFSLPVWNPKTDPIANLPDDDLSGTATTWLRRVDVVAQMPAAWWIIEIKPSAAYVALGQALTYEALAALSWPQMQPAEAVVLTDAHDPALSEQFRNRDVNVYDLPGFKYTPLTRPT